MTFGTKRLNIQPITFFIVYMMVVLLSGFSAINTRQCISLNHSATPYRIINSVTGLPFIICEFVFGFPCLSAAIETRSGKTIGSTIINPKTVSCFPRLTLPTILLIIIDVLQIIINRTTRSFCCNLQYPYLTTHTMNYICPLKNTTKWE